MKHIKTFESFLNEGKVLQQGGDSFKKGQTVNFRLNSEVISGVIKGINLNKKDPKSSKITIEHKGNKGVTSKNSWQTAEIHADQIIVSDKYGDWSISENLDDSLNEAKLFKTIEKTGKLKEPAGGASMNGKYYQLEGDSKYDIIHFDYDAKSKKPFGVVQVAGHHMPSKLLNRLGFRETRSWMAGVEVYIFDGNSNPKFISEAEMAELVNEWGKGFGSYAKSFAKFYQDRGRTSGTID